MSTYVSTTANNPHLQEDDLLLLLSERLDPNRLASVRAHLAHCTDCQAELKNSYLAAILHQRLVNSPALVPYAPMAGERRTERRHPVNESAVMRTLCPYSPAPVEVCIVDVSARGLRIRVPRMLHPGTLIQVRTSRLILLAEVRNCSPSAQGASFAGCEISDVFDVPARGETRVARRATPEPEAVAAFVS